MTKEQVLALIEHQTATQEKTREGTASPAAKKAAWLAATAAVNAAGAFQYTTKQARVSALGGGGVLSSLSRSLCPFAPANQVKSKWDNLVAAYRAAVTKGNASGASAKAKTFWFDAIHALLSERAATAPKRVVEVGRPEGAKLAEKPAEKVATKRKARCKHAFLHP